MIGRASCIGSYPQRRCLARPGSSIEPLRGTWRVPTRTPRASARPDPSPPGSDPGRRVLENKPTRINTRACLTLTFSVNAHTDAQIRCVDSTSVECLFSITLGWGFRIRTISVEGRIGVDSGGIQAALPGEYHGVFCSQYGHCEPQKLDSGFGRIRSRVGFG